MITNLLIIAYTSFFAWSVNDTIKTNAPLHTTEAKIQKKEELDKKETENQTKLTSIYQTGGYMGFASLGLGLNTELISQEVHLGFTPKSLANEDIYQLNFKFIVHPFKLDLNVPLKYDF